MAKSKSVYICESCGWESLKWQGQCSECRSWNTLAEAPRTAPSAEAPGGGRRSQLFSLSGEGAAPQPFSELPADPPPRRSSGLQEFDKVLGGGLVPGAFILLGGAPGIGKSTLLLQAAGHISQAAEAGSSKAARRPAKPAAPAEASPPGQGAAAEPSGRQKVLYISAEESASQTALRARRLQAAGSPGLLFFSESSLEDILGHAARIKPPVLIIDSIQTVYLKSLPSAPGTVSQVRECAAMLMNFAKSSGAAVLAVGHITKDGSLAGPRVLEHLVDTVLLFEGEDHYPFRILRSLKNRFGPVSEIAVFEMSGAGLAEVLSPSEFFLREKSGDRIGSSVFVAREGSRPLLCEIQSLTLPSFLPSPRRTVLGLDINRIHIIAAVLDKYMGAELGKRDLFVSLAGGLKITEPASDLAAAVSLLSSRYRNPVESQSCFFGELGLTGELRACHFAKERALEAGRLGYQRLYLPGSLKPRLKGARLGLELRFKDHIEEFGFLKGA